MSIDLHIGDVLMTNQPTSVRDTLAEGRMAQAANGAHVHSETEFGRVIRFIWGTEGAEEAAVAELRAKRNDQREHTIKYTDLNNVTHEVDVIWRADPSFEIVVPGVYRPVTVTFYERGNG